MTKKSLILCFDGTGNKFQGSAGDSNILKIYSMLDKEDPHVFRYYQPGIGTYVESSSLSKKSRVGRIKSWYKKAKDQAVGTSFGEHVMAGYKFLMRYYSAGDDIYFFGWVCSLLMTMIVMVVSADMFLVCAALSLDMPLIHIAICGSESISKVLYRLRGKITDNDMQDSAEERIPLVSSRKW